MFLHTLIEWCDTDIQRVDHFKSRVELNKYVRENHPEEAALAFEDGSDYYTDECGYALEAVGGELHG